MVVTGTKRKKILRDMADTEGVISYPRLAVIASKYQVTPIEVRDLLVNNGFVCDDVPNKHTRAEPKPKVIKQKHECPLSELEINLIKSGKLYKAVGDSAVICQSIPAFQRERAAIMKLLSVFET